MEDWRLYAAPCLRLTASRSVVRRLVSKPGYVRWIWRRTKRLFLSSLSVSLSPLSFLQDLGSESPPQMRWGCPIESFPKMGPGDRNRDSDRTPPQMRWGCPIGSFPKMVPRSEGRVQKPGFRPAVGIPVSALPPDFLPRFSQSLSSLLSLSESLSSLPRVSRSLFSLFPSFFSLLLAGSGRRKPPQMRWGFPIGSFPKTVKISRTPQVRN